MSSLDVLQDTVRRDDDAKPLHGLAPQSWPVPDKITISDGELVGDWSRGFHERSATDGALPAFLALAGANDAAVLRYARRWGVLNLCRHGLPTLHDGAYSPLFGQELDGPPGSICEDLGGPRFREPLTLWRSYAARARAVIALSVRLRNGDVLNTASARDDFVTARLGLLYDGQAHADVVALYTAMMGPFDPAPFARVLASYADNPVARAAIQEVHDQAAAMTEEEARRMWLGLDVAGRVRDWMSLGNVSLGLEWDGDAIRPKLQAGRVPGLFGALAAELFRAVAGASLALCSQCGTVYQPTRKPAATRRSYCSACREAGVPSRDASRHWYRRTRVAQP